MHLSIARLLEHKCTKVNIELSNAWHTQFKTYYIEE